MRLAAVETGHSFGDKILFALARMIAGGVPDVVKAVRHRPEFFGGPFGDVLHGVMRGPSDWSPGERELFAAFTSRVNQCPF